MEDNDTRLYHSVKTPTTLRCTAECMKREIVTGGQ